MADRTETLRRAPHDHVVCFYDGDAELVGDVVPFLADGLETGDVAVIVATPEHLRSFQAALEHRGLDLEQLRDDGLCLCFDAEETLAALSIDGVPDADRFVDVIGSVVADAAAKGHRVRAFGEMVGLLWEAGDIAAAISLESFWNDLCDRHDLFLWCAYRASSITESEVGSIAQVCAQHSDVVPLASYAAASSATAAIDEMTERSHLFLPVPESARAVRRFLTETLVAWGAEDLIRDASLVGSELAGNAVRHAASPFRMTVRRSGGDLVIAVHDASSSMPEELPPAAIDAQSGRGVAIVAALSTHWGTDVLADGKVVWAALSPS
jgi:hypothetical protein